MLVVAVKEQFRKKMKLFLIVYFFLNLSYSQTKIKVDSLELVFKNYAKDIVTNESDSKFLHPKLKHYANKSSGWNFSSGTGFVYKKSEPVEIIRKNKYVAINKISKQYKIKGTEYRLIDYMLIYETTFTSTFFENMKKSDSIQKTLIGKRTSGGVSNFKLNFTTQVLIAEINEAEKSKIVLYADSNRVLAVKSKEDGKWYFISRNISRERFLKSILPNRMVNKLLKSINYNLSPVNSQDYGNYLR